jgi:hypothetical protein
MDKAIECKDIRIPTYLLIIFPYRMFFCRYTLNCKENFIISELLKALIPSLLGKSFWGKIYRGSFKAILLRTTGIKVTLPIYCKNEQIPKVALWNYTYYLLRKCKQLEPLILAEFDELGRSPVQIFIRALHTASCTSEKYGVRFILRTPCKDVIF